MIEQLGYFWTVILLIAVTLGLTVFVFRHRLFDRGYKKGTAANPQRVRKQNPPDGHERMS